MRRNRIRNCRFIEQVQIKYYVNKTWAILPSFLSSLSYSSSALNNTDVILSSSWNNTQTLRHPRNDKPSSIWSIFLIQLIHFLRQFPPTRSFQANLFGRCRCTNAWSINWQWLYASRKMRRTINVEVTRRSDKGLDEHRIKLVSNKWQKSGKSETFGNN